MTILYSEAEKDSDLYNEFLNGNNDAFNFIVKRYRKQVISFIYKYCRNYEIAEDLAQDTFLYVIINKKEYDFKYSMKTYLYTIAKSRTINYLKKNKNNISFDEEYITEVDSFKIDSNLIREEEKLQIYKSIKRLKDNYQIAIYLKDIQGFENREICKILNKPMPQVKMLIYRARKSLRKVLSEGSEK